jgi:hypothetical protein
MSTDVSEVHAASIIRAMMEAARTSETSVEIQLRTRKYMPEDSELQIPVYFQQRKSQFYSVTSKKLANDIQ